MKQEPQKEHEWLRKLVGEWTSETEIALAPDQPPTKFVGTESGKMLGDLWVQVQGQGEMPGGGIGYTVMTLGFDPPKNAYVGTWIGSMMTYLWPYNGKVDPNGNILRLDSEGPNCMTQDGTTAKYQDVIEFHDDDYRTLKGHMMGPDGQWQQMMVCHYRRKK